MEKIKIFDQVQFDESIVKYEYHSYQPRTSNFGNNDEIRITIQNQDIYTHPSESFIYLSGEVDHNVTAGKNFDLTNNAFAFLFEEIRYELNGVEVDRTRDLGITSTMKGYLSYNDSDHMKALGIAGWVKGTASSTIKTYFTNKKFFALIPLKCLLGFAEDYQKLMVNAKQELILLRSSTDINCFKCDDDAGVVAKIGFKLNKIEWRVPHVQLNDDIKLQMMERINMDPKIQIPFRKWEMHELPTMKKSIDDIWAVKTSSSLERPRYIIIAFQKNKKNVASADASTFDHCSIKNMRVYLNSESYPYDQLNLNFTSGDYLTAYNMYCQFQKSYYDRSNDPYFSYTDFKNHMLFVFDVSKQNESVKSSTIDLRIEMEADAAFSDNTRCYCLILSESIVEYTPLTNIVRKLI